MTGKRKSTVGRAGRSEADLGQKEAELEKSGKDQMSHMEGGGTAKTAQRP